MMNLLAPITVGGQEFDWDTTTAVFWLLIIQAVLIVIEIAVFAVLIARTRKKETRTVLGLSLDAKNAKKEFVAGEQFVCEGLSITVKYNTDPERETVGAYSVVTEEDYGRIAARGDVTGCYVIMPDLSVAGTKTVVVRYDHTSAFYPVTVTEAEPVAEEPAAEPLPAEPVREAPAAAPTVIEEESVRAGSVRYDKSFTARFIQSEDEVKVWYTKIKNELLSYSKVRERVSWKYENYRFGKEPVAKLSFRGKTLCLLLPLDPKELSETKYKVEDISDMASAEDLPCMYRIKNDRRAQYACELIARVMERYDSVKTEREMVDYFVPYEGVVELIEKGLIKRKVSTYEADEFLRSRQSEAAAAKADEDGEDGE